jgi:oligoendopeptidase F
MIMTFTSSAAVANFADSTASASGDRNAIPIQYTWNLHDLYASRQAWQEDKKAFPARFEKAGSFQNNLTKSAGHLYEALDYIFEVAKDLSKFYSYASMLSDQDTREADPLAMQQEAQQLYSKFGTQVSYLDPAILAIEEALLNQYFTDEPRLEDYRQYIDNIYRKKAHTLSGAEEKIIAQTSIMRGNSSNTYSVFKNAEIPRPVVTLADGKEVRLDDAAYTLHRASENRSDRQRVLEAFFESLSDFEMTIGTQLYGELTEHLFTKNVRNYNSCLEAALDANNIPVEVYHGLIDNVNKNLNTLHRYLALRKRMLGVDTLHYYDIYAPLVKEVDLQYSYEEAQKLIIDGLALLGPEYTSTLATAFDNRWIDIFPNTGKRAGAYSNGSAYDVHPYILMNYNGKYDDVSTLAHELGHTMHSYFSNKHQPYANAGYPIFLAEVASTANEAILMNHILKSLQNPQERLAILGNYLEGCRGTLFRQTQFAEFELKIHEKAESGESLTGKQFSELYLDILKKYYGHQEGVTHIDDRYAIEWAFIPHFYYNFYVFQYSTSFTASQALAENMLSGGDDMVQKYIQFLSAGSSDYAIPALRKVDVDMTTSEPFDLTIKRMNEVMDEMEALLAQMNR